MSCLHWAAWAAKKAAEISARQEKSNEYAMALLNGDILLSRLGSPVPFNECSYSNEASARKQVEKMKQNAPDMYTLELDYQVMFCVSISSLAVDVFQKATTYTNTNGYHGYSATLSLPLNGTITPFYLEILIPETEDIDLSTVMCTLSVVGDVTP